MGGWQGHITRPMAEGRGTTCPRCGAGLRPGTTASHEAQRHQDGSSEALFSEAVWSILRHNWKNVSRIWGTHHFPQNISFPHCLWAMMGPFQVRHHGGRSTVPDGLLATEIKCWGQSKCVLVSDVSFLSKYLPLHTIKKSPQTVSDIAELWQLVHSFQKKENIVYLYKLSEYPHDYINNAGSWYQHRSKIFFNSKICILKGI